MKEQLSLFGTTDYVDYLADWIKHRPRNGFGQLAKIAKHLNISSVSVSYIFNRKRHLTDEQAVEMCLFLGLNEIESDYFVLLVQKARAGSYKLEQRIEKKLQQIRQQAEDIRNRVPEHKAFNEQAQATFYSQWYYSAVRLASSIEGKQDIAALAEHFGLPVARVRQVVDFLVAHGLCIEKDQKIRMGPQRTHVPADSPLASRHHVNWRLQSIERAHMLDNDELYFTGPMTLSTETFQQIREQMLDLISRTTKLIEPSKSEILACMNLDLFKIKSKTNRND